jgi:hypothetical protein
MRIQGLENLRQDNYLDTSDPSGLSVGTMTAGGFAEANKAEPGRYIKYTGQAANALKARGMINDIRAGMGGLNAAIDALPPGGMSAKGRAFMEKALQDPRGPVDAVMSGLAASGLSTQEQNFAIQHSSAVERAMSLRGLQGQGAGSDQQRAAIARIVPGIASAANKAMMKNQMATFKNNVDNVDQTIPRVGKANLKPIEETPVPSTTGGKIAQPTGATHTGRGSVDKKLHWLDAQGKDLGLAE